MEAIVSGSLQLPTWMNLEKPARKSNRSLQFFQKCGQHHCYRTSTYHFPTREGLSWQRPLVVKASHSSENFPSSVLESGCSLVSFNETKILESKAKETEKYLNGRCIFLVGMMGSGKTTVGKVLSQALGYSFHDCDTLIEQAVEGTTVAEIFKLHGESFFRDNETEVLRKLSMMHGLVVSTGGGVVVRPINWRYMQKGISVWLDVPLEALARRITAVGTNSRPLLHHESGDTYRKTMKRLSALFEERGEAYANANARVSLENIAAKLRDTDICKLTPTVIAIEVLEQIEKFLKK